MGRLGLHVSHSRPPLLALGAVVAALTLSVASCGGGRSSDANEEAGRFPVKVLSATFPTQQQLGQTSLMKLEVRNTGRRALPALTVNVTIAGKEGHASTIPFAVHDPQPGLAQADRPIWVLSARYPRFNGSAEPAGAETSNQQTFDFGGLKPGRTAKVVWKLNAVRAGHYTLLYSIDAGLGGRSKAVTGGGVAPGGSFSVDIASKPYDTEVTDSGEVVRVPTGGGQPQRSK